jgi:putative RecB family exonuclease
MTVLARPSPNEVAHQLTGRSYLSYSAVSTYQACPLRYFFRYVAGLPEESVSASLVFGGAIHRAAEIHYGDLLEGRGEADLRTLLAAYDAAWSPYDVQDVRYGHTETRTTLDALASRVLAAFLESDLSQPAGTILGIEEELTGTLVAGVPDLLARVDLIVDEGDAVVLTDLKTARSAWSADQVRSSAVQLLLYHELARPLADGRPLRVQFAVLTKTKTPEVLTYPVDVDPRQIERTKRVVERVWRGIESQHFYPRPSPIECPSCPFRRACEAWQG